MTHIFSKGKAHKNFTQEANRAENMFCQNADSREIQRDSWKAKPDLDVLCADSVIILARLLNQHCSLSRRAKIMTVQYGSY